MMNNKRGEYMANTIKEIIEILDKYFVYLYPGFISLYIFYFSKARKMKGNIITITVSLVISYVYILIYRTFCSKAVSDFKDIDYIILLIIAIVFPIIWHNISKSGRTEKILDGLGFNTTLEDDVWAYIQSRDKEKKGIVLKVFLDDKDIMYEGSLRYRESSDEKEKTICLSGYRRYLKEDGKYYIKQDYNNDNSRWVLIDISKITRSEIKYVTEK